LRKLDRNYTPRAKAAWFFQWKDRDNFAWTLPRKDCARLRKAMDNDGVDFEKVNPRTEEANRKLIVVITTIAEPPALQGENEK